MPAIAWGIAAGLAALGIGAGAGAYEGGQQAGRGVRDALVLAAIIGAGLYVSRAK